MGNRLEFFYIFTTYFFLSNLSNPLVGDHGQIINELNIYKIEPDQQAHLSIWLQDILNHFNFFFNYIFTQQTRGGCTQQTPVLQLFFCKK